MAKVIFDGERELIIVNPGETSIDIRKDVYSEWKRWFIQDDNSKFNKAFRVVGGDILPEDQLGLTYFLLGNWKIRPFEGDHRLIIKGNLYKQNGEDPIADTIGDFKVTVSMKVSNLIDMISTGVASASVAQTELTVDPELLDGISSQEEWSITAS